VFASLNGNTPGGWIRYAKMMQDEGADALELNFYDVPTDIEASPQDVENRFLELIASVKQSISIPLGIKVGPYFSALLHLSNRIKETGAEGLVMLQPLHPARHRPRRACRCTRASSCPPPASCALPLRWIAHPSSGRVEMGLSAAPAACTAAEDVIKLIFSPAPTCDRPGLGACCKPRHAATRLIDAGGPDRVAREATSTSRSSSSRAAMSQLNSPASPSTSSAPTT
jgi:dihydroorotate dehydrogenase (fumarate)